MNVELTKTAGFCFGVKRAVDTVYKQIEKHQSEKIFTYGPIIHNEEVIKDLRSHGVEVLNDEEELKTVDADVVVIRSHGVAKYIYDIMDERGITCVDATCPFVKKIHKIVAEVSAASGAVGIISMLYPTQGTFFASQAVGAPVVSACWLISTQPSAINCSAHSFSRSKDAQLFVYFTSIVAESQTDFTPR